MQFAAGGYDGGLRLDGYGEPISARIFTDTLIAQGRDNAVWKLNMDDGLLEADLGAPAPFISKIGFTAGGSAVVALDTSGSAWIRRIDQQSLWEKLITQPPLSTRRFSSDANRAPPTSRETEVSRNGTIMAALVAASGRSRENR